MSLKWRLKDNCQKNKRQRYDICRVLGVTLRDKEHRCEIIKALASSHFSESRDPSYVSSAIYPECPRKEWRAKSFGIQSNVHWRLVYLVRDGFLYCFCLLAESYATINHYQSTPTGKLPKVRPRTRWRDYSSNLAWSRLGVERAELHLLNVRYFGPPRAAVLATLPKGKAGTKMSGWICKPTLNLCIYEIVFSLFAKSECRIQIIEHVGRKLAFLWKSVKSIKHRRENGVDTLKLHHDTLLKTFKKTLSLMTLNHKCTFNSLLSRKVWLLWVFLSLQTFGMSWWALVPKTDVQRSLVLGKALLPT